MKVILKNGEVIESSLEEKAGRNALCNTAAHILAQAIKRLYPETKCASAFGEGNEFHYDFEFGFRIGLEHLSEIEKQMKEIVKEALTVEHFKLSREDAMAELEKRQEGYKLELLADMPKESEIDFIRQGEYVGMCMGEHLQNTSQVKAVKLTSLAGAYWKGDEENEMLTRIYGIVFIQQSQLDDYIARLEEARARDHRKLGKELGIFTLMEEGSGFPFFLPKGLILKNLLLDYWRKVHEREGYVEISTPVMLKRKLWELSGHWDNYRENMYTAKIDEEEYAIKPMNCPGGMLVYKMQPHSYKELPIRMGELGLVHRNEKSGTLHGLMRVRMFTQDDAHIFMTREQVTDEIKAVVRLIDEFYRRFGFKYHVELSTRPEKSIGSDEEWNEAIAALKLALEDMKIEYVINEGDGAFYGPKIDFHLEDSIGRTWQCGTIQLDFQLPQRFKAEYIGPDGQKHQPVMIHRVVFGSIERFIGILIEHYNGKFPLWLAPVQVKLLPVSDAFLKYALLVHDKLKAAGIRCELDASDEKLGYKMREARLERVSYILVVGQREQDEKKVAVRHREEGDLGSIKVEDFIRRIESESDDSTSCQY